MMNDMSAGEPDSSWRLDLPAGITRRLLVVEVVVVLAVSLGRSGVYAVVDFVASVTAPGPLVAQRAVLNRSLAPGQPNLDLVLQLLAIGFGLAPVALVAYLLMRSGSSPAEFFYRRGEGVRDVVRGATVALAVGSVGLAFYFAARGAGFNLTVVPEQLPGVWWRYPVLILSAIQNAVLEETVVLGYLLLRLRQCRMGFLPAIMTSSAVRGSYHLYQGLGGFVGNFAMGMLFGYLYRKWDRVAPLIVCHTLLDVGAFVGYALLAPHFTWIPS